VAYHSVLRAKIKKREPSIFFYPSSTRIRVKSEIEDPINEVNQVELTITDFKGNKTSSITKPNKNKTILLLLNKEGEVSVESKLILEYKIKDIFDDIIGEYREDVENETKKSKANIIPNRTRIKRRLKGFYELNAKFRDPENEVTEIELTLKDFEGKIYNLETKIVKNNIVSLFELPNYDKNLLILNFTLKDKFGKTLNLYRDEVYAE